MYSAPPNFVLGFHGCDQTVADSVVSRQSPHLFNSEEDYDWLGHGIYFWEQNHQRAIDWANDRKANPRKSKSPIVSPAAVGAVIDLGNCLNLLDGKYIDLVKGTHAKLESIFSKAGSDLPRNKNIYSRKLDCAVINSVNEFRKKSGEKPFDTVRGMFSEGDPIFDNSGFKKQNHIQLCVINHNCIKGYFHPMEPVAGFPIP